MGRELTILKQLVKTLAESANNLEEFSTDQTLKKSNEAYCKGRAQGIRDCIDIINKLFYFDE